VRFSLLHLFKKCSKTQHDSVTFEVSLKKYKINPTVSQVSYSFCVFDPSCDDPVKLISLKVVTVHIEEGRVNPQSEDKMINAYLKRYTKRFKYVTEMFYELRVTDFCFCYSASMHTSRKRAQSQTVLAIGPAWSNVDSSGMIPV